MFQSTTALQIDSSFQSLDESSADFYSFGLFFHPSDDITPDFLPMDYACIFGDQPSQSDWAKTLVRKGCKFAREDDGVTEPVTEPKQEVLQNSRIGVTELIIRMLQSGMTTTQVCKELKFSRVILSRRIKGKLKNLGSDRFPKWTRCSQHT